MVSCRFFALGLALLLPAAPAVMAQSSSSSSSSTEAPAAKQSQQPELTPGELSVQARIRARREARRAQAIRDTYGNKYEIFLGGGYLRFQPGPKLQHVTLYSFDTALSRNFSNKLGVTVDGRGYYGTPFVGVNFTGITRPAISQYDVLVGPTYRFIANPKYSIAGRVMGGVAMGNFSGDTNGFGTANLGLFPDGTTYAINGSIIGETNITPNFSLRLAGDYLDTGFGSTMQNSFGFNYGFVYRFGKR
ncbi:MAG: hypothetical protein KGN79_13175 [Acidobacteriota bacterium]|nr:hypothetical protein [Acidobacteriota bacterium]